MEVAVATQLYPVPLHQADDLPASVALVQGRVVEKAQLLPLPRRLQRRLQPDQLPVKDFGGVFPPILLVKPAPGALARQRCVLVLKKAWIGMKRRISALKVTI